MLAPAQSAGSGTLASSTSTVPPKGSKARSIGSSATSPSPKTRPVGRVRPCDPAPVDLQQLQVHPRPLISSSRTSTQNGEQWRTTVAVYTRSTLHRLRISQKDPHHAHETGCFCVPAIDFETSIPSSTLDDLAVLNRGANEASQGK